MRDPTDADRQACTGRVACACPALGISSWELASHPTVRWIPLGAPGSERLDLIRLLPCACREWASRAFVACALALGMTGSVDATTETVSVRVRRTLSIRDNVRISFRSRGQLPARGYYYAVIVLKPYKGYTRTNPPPCSTSSNMERTD
jgi:hypothetical protein